MQAYVETSATTSTISRGSYMFTVNPEIFVRMHFLVIFVHTPGYTKIT